MGSYGYQFGEGGKGLYAYRPDKLVNKNLGWEITHTNNIGLDFGLFNNRISGYIEFYDTRTKDLLMQRSLNGILVDTKDIQWDMNLNMSVNENKIISLTNDQDDISNKWFIGKPINVIYDYEKAGIWQTNEAAEAAKYNAQPGDRKILDAKKDYVINGEDRDFCGVSTPKYYGSFTNTYKGIDLTAFFTFAGGHKINNSLNRYLNSFNVWGNMSENYYKYYWRQDRPNNKYPAPRVGSAYANGDGTDANLQKGDYLRLRNLEIGYSLPKNVIRNIKASNIRVYFSVQNLFTATEFTGFDVESSDNTNPYPNARSFIGGISLNF